MTLASLRTTDPLRIAAGPSLWRRMNRWAALGVGGVLMSVGFVGALLPGHLGAPILVAGLIIVLRASPQARRRFIGLQQRHPNIVYPIRRLLRRRPEVAPVAWQQFLRFERLVMPRTWRTATRLRHRVFRPERRRVAR